MLMNVWVLPNNRFTPSKLKRIQIPLKFFFSHRLNACWCPQLVRGNKETPEGDFFLLAYKVNEALGIMQVQLYPSVGDGLEVHAVLYGAVLVKDVLFDV